MEATTIPMRHPKISSLATISADLKSGISLIRAHISDVSCLWDSIPSHLLENDDLFSNSDLRNSVALARQGF